MPKGLPISYIKKWGISKLAWKKFRAGALTKGVPTRTFPKKKGSSKGKSMAKKKRSRRGSMTIPLAPIVGLAAGMAKPVERLMAGDYVAAIGEMSYRYIGFNPQDNSFDAKRMTLGLLPLVVGLLVHKFVGGKPLNFNAMLARAKVPFIRI